MNTKVIWLGLGALLLALCSVADAQQSQKIYKVGRLSAGSPADPLSEATYDVFQEGLRDLGWVEGKNIVLENRWVGDKTENAVNQAAELVRRNVDVIVAVGSPMIQAAKQATTAIPIVMSGTGADPEVAGFVASLRRPGGNITGLSIFPPSLAVSDWSCSKRWRPALGASPFCAIQNFRQWQSSQKRLRWLQSFCVFSFRLGKCAARRRSGAHFRL